MYVNTDGCVILNKVAREGLYEEMEFEKRFESSGAMSHVNIGGGGSEWEEAPVFLIGSAKTRPRV